MITANFATHKARKGSIDRAVESIRNQVDFVRVHYNDYEPEERDWLQYTGKDLTDKGKFAHIRKGEIVFTCDDDILYPPDYVSKTLEVMNRHKGRVITYHGRKLRGEGLDYYRGHTSYHFMQTVIKDEQIDVPGTGVMAFNTDDIFPDILQYSEQKMVDLLFALEAKKAGIGVVCAGHVSNWLSVLTIKDSIYNEMVHDCKRQSEIADQLV